MITKIIAMVLHDIVEEYQKLNAVPDQKDESVLSFSSGISPGRTEEDVVPMGSVTPFNDIDGLDSLPLDADGGYSGAWVGFNKLNSDDLVVLRLAEEKLGLR
jgi:hypothetical protein